MYNKKLDNAATDRFHYTIPKPSAKEQAYLKQIFTITYDVDRQLEILKTLIPIPEPSLLPRRNKKYQEIINNINLLLDKSNEIINILS